MTDRQILDDYVLWSTTRELDTSITAFLDERKAEADALRINEAIAIYDAGPMSYERDKDGEPIGRLDWHEVAEQMRSALIDDRPTIDEGTLTERRTVLA